MFENINSSIETEITINDDRLNMIYKPYYLDVSFDDDMFPMVDRVKNIDNAKFCIKFEDTNEYYTDDTGVIIASGEINNLVEEILEVLIFEQGDLNCGIYDLKTDIKVMTL